MSERAEKTSGYTWGDYRAWPDDQRFEIIAGEAHAMTPAPTPRHQTIVTELAGQFSVHFKGKPCKPFVSPIDIKLSDEDIVQPDLVVVCDPEQIKRTHIEGPPTLVIEVLSPSTASHDRVRKLPLFARSGIEEVWLITPYPWLAEVLILDGESYRLVGIYEKKDTLQSIRFPDLAIELETLFNYPIDPDEQIELVKEVHPPYAAGRV